jgi:hypothetical protein
VFEGTGSGLVKNRGVGWFGIVEVMEEQDSCRERTASNDRRRVSDFAERLWVRVRDGRAHTLSYLVEEEPLVN